MQSMTHPEKCFKVYESYIFSKVDCIAQWKQNPSSLAATRLSQCDPTTGQTGLVQASLPSGTGPQVSNIISVRIKGKKILLTLRLINQALGLENVWGGGGIHPHILSLGTRYIWVISFKPRPLYPQGKGPRYPLDRRLGGPLRRSGHSKKREILLNWESNPNSSAVQLVARHYTDWSILVRIIISHTVRSSIGGGGSKCRPKSKISPRLNS
jgi:hypothetical protein